MFNPIQESWPIKLINLLLDIFSHSKIFLSDFSFNSKNLQERSGFLSV